MKNKIIININNDYCFGCTETTCTRTITDYLRCRIEDKSYKTESIPITWNDLLINIVCLPKNNKQGLQIRVEHKNAVCNYDKIVIYRKGRKSEYIVAEFWHNGLRFWDLQLNATIPQIWDIIKSIMLAGE